MGYHTTLKLLEQDNNVIVIDSFSSDYDVEFKRSRAAILAEKGEKMKYMYNDGVAISERERERELG